MKCCAVCNTSRYMVSGNCKQCGWSGESAAPSYRFGAGAI